LQTQLVEPYVVAETEPVGQGVQPPETGRSPVLLNVPGGHRQPVVPRGALPSAHERVLQPAVPGLGQSAEEQSELDVQVMVLVVGPPVGKQALLIQT
jgi:hypothetical protein